MSSDSKPVNSFVRSPVLLLLFNRLECTKEVFASISVVKPAKLYIAIDGPREQNATDVKKVNAVKEYVFGNIHWACELKTLVRDTNLGCKEAVSSAISWFFEQEEEGIILEDDCLPNISFFRFCDTLLEKYRVDERVRHISGVNFLDTEISGTASYYFSRFTHVWGWASWRRVWKDYDKDMPLLEKFLQNGELWNIYPDQKIINVLAKEFQRVKSGKLNTWDFQYLFLNFIHNGLCIIPRKSLIKNIGFGADSTHEHGEQLKLHKAEEMDEIIHPEFFVPQLQLDMQSLIKMNNLSIMGKVKSKFEAIFLKK